MRTSTFSNSIYSQSLPLNSIVSYLFAFLTLHHFHKARDWRALCAGLSGDDLHIAPGQLFGQPVVDVFDRPEFPCAAVALEQGRLCILIEAEDEGAVRLFHLIKGAQWPQGHGVLHDHIVGSRHAAALCNYYLYITSVFIFCFF